MESAPKLNQRTIVNTLAAVTRRGFCRLTPSSMSDYCAVVAVANPASVDALTRMGVRSLKRTLER